MRTGLFLICIWFFSGTTRTADAQNPSSIPKIAFTFDFNAPFSDDHILGARAQVYSNNRYFGNSRKWHGSGNALAWTYGVGLGDYKVGSLKKKDGSEDNLYLLFASFTICHQNNSIFEPFVGVYPGIAWGIKSGVFANPVAGIQVSTFRVRRNWNSILFQSYVQVRIEYNTVLSTPFLGCSLILQVM
jgi:hypothetical protein